MEQVSRVVEAEPGKIDQLHRGARQGKRTAIFDGGPATASRRATSAREDGPRNSHLHYSITPYREAEDPEKGSDDWFPTGSPTGSQVSGANRERPVPPSGSSPKGRTAGTSQRGTGSPTGSRGTTHHRTTTSSDPSLFGEGLKKQTRRGSRAETATTADRG